MSRLFRRVWRVQVGTLATEDIDISFKVTRNLSPYPGTCELTLYNLSPDHRAELRPSAFGRLRVFCQLDAGYEGARSMLFRGDTRRIEHKRDGVDWVTVITAGDGIHAIRNARVRASFAPGTTIATIVDSIVQQMEVGAGNSREILSTLAATTTVRAGTVLHGQAAQELTRICTANGLEWSIQDGALQLLRRGGRLARTGILLSPESGLLGSPERAGYKRFKVQSLLIPDLVPGRVVVLDSSTARGDYKVMSAEYSGDTRSEDWTCSMVVRDTALDAPLIVASAGSTSATPSGSS